MTYQPPVRDYVFLLRDVLQLERYANLPDLSTIPVVVLTGRDPRIAEPATRKFHVAAFLQKPADNKDLVEAIERALRTQTAHGRRPFTPPSEPT